MQRWMRRPPTTDGSRDCDEETQYTITGPDQKFRKNDQKLPGNGNFKNERKVSVAWIGKRLLLQYLRREKSQRVIWRLLTVHSWSTASDICHQATAPTSRHSHSLPCCQCHSWTYNSRSLRHRLVGDPYRCHWESASRSEVDGEYNPGLRGGEYEAIHHCIKYCWSPRRMQVRMWFHICVLQVKYTHLTYLRLLKLTNICLAQHATWSGIKKITLSRKISIHFIVATLMYYE